MSTPGPLSDRSAVRAAREVLAAYDTGAEQDPEGRWWSVNDNPDYWAGRVAAALRIVLAEIDQAGE